MIVPTLPARKATGQSKMAIKKDATKTSIAAFRIGHLSVTVSHSYTSKRAPGLTLSLCGRTA
jgi:hypothetical protein